MHFHKFTAVLLSGSLLLIACNNAPTNNAEKAEEEIAKAESDFAKMAAEKGVAEAFYFFADSNATIKRQNDTLIHGRDNIRNYYSTPFYKTAKASWAPDFTEASASGDMGYTYGKYTWESKDSLGKTNSFSGIFHTVWKKQADGSWKYVWD